MLVESPARPSYPLNGNTYNIEIEGGGRNKRMLASQLVVDDVTGPPSPIILNGALWQVTSLLKGNEHTYSVILTLFGFRLIMVVKLNKY